VPPSTDSILIATSGFGEDLDERTAADRLALSDGFVP
jgi:hypothetical protein